VEARRQTPRVSVEINDNFLIIRGEGKFEQDEIEGGIWRSERRYGEFYRAIALPEGADAENTRGVSKRRVARGHPGSASAEQRAPNSGASICGFVAAAGTETCEHAAASREGSLSRERKTTFPEPG
jgi:hypothetical protein